MRVAACGRIWNLASRMSEFKYACPVCGQHIKCDSSQTGTTMVCPTCFQKIIVPQAPASEDQKFILTGTKVGERPPVKDPEANPYASTPAKNVPGAVVVLVILLFIAVAVAFVFRGTIFKPHPRGPATNQKSFATNGGSSKATVVAPEADDTNWMLNLAAVRIPDGTAAGRIHGQDFIIEHASFNNGTLILRAGTNGPLTFGVTINFSGAPAEALAGKNLNILADTNKSARVSLHWQDEADNGRDSFQNSYALRLQFGNLTDDRLPGKIYLCTPDPQRSYLMGSFTAEVHPANTNAQ
jgi:DNA-directed RNA polymerase subunit RPC12/RpoP